MENVISSDIKQFIVFRLGNEEYGLDTLKITTIVRMMTITRVPKTPSFIKGVINLRGDIIPVMDLRKRFNLSESEETEDTRIIIIKIDEILIGVMVDAVVEVLHLTEESIENVTNFTNDLSMDYIFGVGKVDNRIVTLLNFEKLIKFSNNE
ncbi:MAG: chemotaxis protein CheW [Clostridia bacterium]|nr:chemotaxis protein CheW [Clostridia bacterium]